MVEKIDVLDVEVVAFAVVCFDHASGRTVRQVKSFRELREIRTDEDANIDEFDLTGIEREMKQLV